MNAMNDLKTDHTNAAWHARRQAATPRGVGVMGDFFIERAKNAEFWDIEGRRFIDFAGRHRGAQHRPRAPQGAGGNRGAVAALHPQLLPGRPIHRVRDSWPNASTPSCPSEGPAKTAFFSTGAEAVENAIKIARHVHRTQRCHRFWRSLPRPKPVRGGP